MYLLSRKRYKFADRLLKYDMMTKKKKIAERIQNRADYQIFQECNCLPSCSSLHYMAESSQTRLHAVKTFEIAYNRSSELKG